MADEVIPLSGGNLTASITRGRALIAARRDKWERALRGGLWRFLRRFEETRGLGV